MIGRSMVIEELIEELIEVKTVVEDGVKPLCCEVDHAHVISSGLPRDSYV